MGAIITHKFVRFVAAALCNIYYFFGLVCFVFLVLFLFLSSAAREEKSERKKVGDFRVGQRSPSSRRERLMMADQWRLLSFTILHDRINRCRDKSKRHLNSKSKTSNGQERIRH